MPAREPIDLLTNLSMPAPWSGDLPGETWISGDYYAIVAHNCVWNLSAAEAMASKPMTPQGFHFPHCLHVFSKPLHSLRPVLCVAVARVNYRNHPLMGDMGAGPRGDGWGAEILEVYTSSGRANMGEFPANFSREAARLELFTVWKTECNLANEPRFLGSIDDAWGHPETGLKSREASKFRAAFDPARPVKRQSWLGRLFS